MELSLLSPLYPPKTFPEEQYFIPGYTGHCPLKKWTFGKTYGKATHDLIVSHDILGGRLGQTPNEAYAAYFGLNTDRNREKYIRPTTYSSLTGGLEKNSNAINGKNYDFDFEQYRGLYGDSHEAEVRKLFSSKFSQSRNPCYVAWRSPIYPGDPLYEGTKYLQESCAQYGALGYHWQPGKHPLYGGMTMHDAPPTSRYDPKERCWKRVSNYPYSDEPQHEGRMFSPSRTAKQEREPMYLNDIPHDSGTLPTPRASRYSPGIHHRTQEQGPSFPEGRAHSGERFSPRKSGIREQLNRTDGFMDDVANEGLSGEYGLQQQPSGTEEWDTRRSSGYPELHSNRVEEHSGNFHYPPRMPRRGRGRTVSAARTGSFMGASDQFLMLRPSLNTPDGALVAPRISSENDWTGTNYDIQPSSYA